MAVFNAAGLILAGFLVVTVALYVTVVGAFWHTRAPKKRFCGDAKSARPERGLVRQQYLERYRRELANVRDETQRLRLLNLWEEEEAKGPLHLSASGAANCCESAAVWQGHRRRTTDPDRQHPHHGLLLRNLWHRSDARPVMRPANKWCGGNRRRHPGARWARPLADCDSLAFNERQPQTVALSPGIDAEMLRPKLPSASQARLILIGTALLLALGMGMRQSFGLFMAPVHAGSRDPNRRFHACSGSPEHCLGFSQR